MTNLICPRCGEHYLEYLPTSIWRQPVYVCPDCLPTEFSCGLRVPAYFSISKIIHNESDVKTHQLKLFA